jgi:hypothetical protein
VPRLYGTVAISGNILWLENNQLKETVRKKKSGGKGGGSSQTVETFSYSATFALGLCEGPIVGVRRIWCMDKLIYNAGSSDPATVIASNRNAQGWRVYLGSDSQMPDTRYEANVGSGNASAFRGMAYIVFYDFQLADYSNTLQAAQFKVEVVKKGQDINVIYNKDPGTERNFSYSSVFSVDSDIYGATVLSYASTVSDVGSRFYRHARFDLGSLRGQSKAIAVSDANALADIECVRSTDGNRWFQYLSNNTFVNECFAKSSEGHWLTLGIISKVQDMLKISEQGTSQENYVFVYSSDPSNYGSFNRIGYAGLVKNSSAKSVILRHLVQSANWNVSTCGDEPYEWRIQSNSFQIRIYDDNLSPVVTSFSVSLPAGQWPTMNAGASFGPADVCCRLINRTVYLCKIEPGTGYRYCALNSNGILFNYVIETDTTGQTGVSAIWPYDADQAVLQTNARLVQWRRYNYGTEALADILVSECVLSGQLSESDIDVSGVANVVKGYRVSGGSIRSAVEPLQAAYPFDVIPSGYKIKFLPRGGSSSLSIPWQDLGASDGQPGAIIPASREMDSQLPVRTNIKYLDANREYASSEQYAERTNTESVNRVDRELPIVLDADEAAGVAEVLTFLPWLERTEYSLSLPPIYSAIEPADIFSVIDRDGSIYQLRAVAVKDSQNGSIAINARPNRAALYSPEASGSEPEVPDGTVPLSGVSIFIPLDIPVVDETLQNAVGFVGLVTSENQAWPGALLVRSGDGGQTWTDLQAYADVATVGTARNVLTVNACTLIDQTVLTVDMISGEIFSITRDQMLDGNNYAAYGVPGRWEIVRFQNAQLNADGSYRVNGFVRGEKGTEWASGLHEERDYFVYLADPDNAFIGMSAESIGTALAYRPVTSGAAIDDAEETQFTYDGVNLQCLSPVYPKATRDGSGNFTATFMRRTRLTGTWWTTGTNNPLGEESQSFEVEVINGSAVARTINTSTLGFSYSAANQTADFGSPQSSITFRIYQMSAVVGRGYPLEVTL